MMTLLLLILFFLSSTSVIFCNEYKSEYQHRECQLKQKKQRKRIILIGDSITEQAFSLEHHGFAALFSDFYVRSADVLNRGYSGYNTRWIKYMLPQLFPTDNYPKTDYIIATLMLGSNDCSTDQQHVPLIEYKHNLLDIISYLKTEVNPDIKIILITPPPINHELMDQKKWNNRIEIPRYAQVINDISIQQNLPLVNLWNGTISVKFDTKIVLSKTPHDLSDGLHLGKGGNVKVFQGIEGIITTHYPHLHPDKFYHGPAYTDLGNLASPQACKQKIETWELI